MSQISNRKERNGTPPNRTGLSLPMHEGASQTDTIRQDEELEVISRPLTAALAELEMKFIINLPESELATPDRLFFQIEQVGLLGKEIWYYT